MKNLRWIACCILLTVNASAIADVKPAGIFSDNMVLQRDAHVNVWGTADPGEKITVEISGQLANATAGDNGLWKVILNPMSSGGPFEMKISGKNQVSFSNILIGDVWLASGQSNMEWSLNKGVDNAEQEKANANYNHIRLFKVERNLAQQPLETILPATWKICKPETVADFSAVGYFFGREIHQRNDVPIGIIQSAWGGTPAETWTSYEMLYTIDAYRDEAEKYRTGEVDWQSDVEANEQRAERLNEILDDSYQGLEEGIQFRNYNDFQWDVVSIPGWNKETRNVVWLRKTIEIPRQFKGQDLKLHLGIAERLAEVYFNGTKIGESERRKPIEMTVEGDLIKSGKNVIVIRLTNGWSYAKMKGPASDMFLATTTGVRLADLSGIWKFNDTLEPEAPEVKKYQNYSAALFNAMINPIIPYNLKGVIWYQGESNTGKADEYNELFSKMITDWRIRWGQGYTPFLFVQLANFMRKSDEPEDTGWARLREAQLQTLTLPNTGMAVTIDIGEAFDIHPRNKQDVGKRLALVAEKVAYGKNLIYSGPVYQSYEINGSEVEIEFEHFGSGLMAKGGKLKGFAIAGKDKKFVWADAQIVGGKVFVSSPEVEEPAAVRYAWGNNPEATLYNKDGLPASPFRTDNW